VPGETREERALLLCIPGGKKEVPTTACRKKKKKKSNGGAGVLSFPGIELGEGTTKGLHCFAMSNVAGEKKKKKETHNP